MDLIQIVKKEIKTVEDVRKRLNLLSALAADIKSEQDVWVANHYEYNLMLDVIHSIGTGKTENPMLVANEAWLSRSIPFPRRIL